MTAEAKYYQEKNKGYFKKIRYEILPLIPAHSDRVVEIGCGAGETLSFLKSSGRCGWIGGIELSSEAARSAKEKLDFLQEGNIEAMELPFDKNSVDVILCLDVLEHLVDPWSVVRRLDALLKPGGALVVSIPNIRNYRVVLPLLLFGKWRYSDWGILDKTHLRFFTKESALRLAECSGLRVDKIAATGLSEGKAAIANMITLSLLKPFFEFQYLIRAIKEKN